jgi:hypothetical protein
MATHVEASQSESEAYRRAGWLCAKDVQPMLILMNEGRQRRSGSRGIGQTGGPGGSLD